MRSWLLASVILCGCSGAVNPGWSVDASDAGDAGTDAFIGPTNTCQDGGTGLWHHQVGAPTLTSPQVHLVFWGNYWSTSANGTSEFSTTSNEWNVLFNDPNFYSVISQYGTTGGRLAGTFLSNWEVPTGQMPETDIQSELDNEIQNGTLPAPSSQTLYVVLLPPITQSQYDIQSKFGGHHGWHNNYAYAVCEFTSDFTGVIAHETWEAATNPDLNTGWWGPGGETEVADLCQNNNTTWKLDGYKLPQVWSQQDCRCIP